MLTPYLHVTVDALVRDQQLRARAISHVEALRLRHHDVLPWSSIAAGMQTPDGHVHLATRARGIFAPAGGLLVAALSVKTVVPRGGRRRWYDDRAEPGADHFVYRYQGTDPNARDNRLVRACMELKLPVIYLLGVAPGRFMPLICLVDEERRRDRAFHLTPITRADVQSSNVLRVAAIAPPPIERGYVIREAQFRLHQSRFREGVLDAYSTSCAICSLRHPQLLDAAHILPDGHERGDAVVPNGLALCKLHHAAFDQALLAITPDAKVLIAPDLLAETDGPMLEHGLKAMHGRLLTLPGRPVDRPDRDRLAERFATVDWR